jgi:hypothetical protein
VASDVMVARVLGEVELTTEQRTAACTLLKRNLGEKLVAALEASRPPRPSSNHTIAELPLRGQSIPLEKLTATRYTAHR